MLPLADVQKLSREPADRINQEARTNLEPPDAGKYVGLAKGQVVAVADTLGETPDMLERIEADSARTSYIEASRDYGVIEYIWGIR